VTVNLILSRKGTDVVTIEPTATVADAAKLLSERRIGAIVVTGPDKLVAGILSERDIVRALGARGAQVLDTQVADMMTRKVVTCARGDTLAALMEQMTQGKFRHVPVVEDGKLAGIVSIGDVVKSRLEEMERESDAMREYIRSA